MPRMATLGMLLVAGLAVALYRPGTTVQAGHEDVFAMHGVDEATGGIDEAISGLGMMPDEMGAWANLAAAMEQDGTWDDVANELGAFSTESEFVVPQRASPEDSWVNEPDL